MWRGPATQPVVGWLPARRASGAPLAEPPAHYWLIGPDDPFQRAQARLRYQAARHYAPTSEAMLRGLAAFGEVHRAASGAWRDTLAWAMEPFVAACLVVGNDRRANPSSWGRLRSCSRPRTRAC